MPLNRIRITGLRCLREAELELHPERNYIFGGNAAGKTSLLEGMFVLGRGRSFRSRQMGRLVRRGERGFTVFGTAPGPDGRTRRLGVSYQAGHLEKKIDGEPAAGMAELTAILPVHAIDPSMHALVEGGPSERRRFLDWGVFHVEPGYLPAWRLYRRALSQRNAALKRLVPPAELKPWTHALAAAGTLVEGSRRRYVDQLTPSVADFGTRLLGRPLTLEYRRGWPDDADLLTALEAEDSRTDLATTECGPHRAELVLRIDERQARDEASRGQQKLTAAALILAQVALEGATSPRRSLLLVDDPAAELDGQSLERLLGAMTHLPAQLVYTALTRAVLAPLPEHAVFHVEQGEVRTV